MKTTIFAALVSVFALATISATTAQAGGSKYCWAGYKYVDSYPCWAAEAFEPTK